MSAQTQIGMNRTGMMTSPNQARELLEAEEMLSPIVTGTAGDFVEIKTQAIDEADVLGSVPPPLSMKGAAKTAAKLLTGSKPQVFLDKLAERAAFERGGTRLYDALIVKFQCNGAGGSTATAEQLNEIRAEELAHYHLVTDAIRSLGGDPTAQTPSADLVGVETAGLMQVLNDARTTFADCLNAMLTAELTDVDAWSLLAQLADDAGEEDLARQFREALLEENHHLQHVRTWCQESVRGQA